MPRRKPPYLTGPDIDRHGNRRWYVRRKGWPKIRIRAEYGTEEFWEQYRQALAGELNPSEAGKSSPQQLKAGSFRRLCVKYYKSPKFKNLEVDTQRVRRRILDRICEVDGDKPYALMRARHIRERRDEIADKPEAANALVKALRQLFAFALEYEFVEQNPARDVLYIEHTSKRIHTWTIEEVRQYEECHPVGTSARLAMALLLYTGQRRSDVIVLGRQHAKNGWLKFTQHKNRKRNPVTLEIPILPQLQEIIDSSPCGDLTYLVTTFKKPFSAGGFGNRFRKWCDQAGLPHCSAHGLRSAAATRLAELGCSTHEIMAITGHKTLKEIERYTAAVRQRHLAESAGRKFSEAQYENESVPLDGVVRKGGTKPTFK